jgi:hypothetical protein
VSATIALARARRAKTMVRRGSMDRVRQRAYIKCLQIGRFIVVSSLNMRTHSGHNCGMRDATRRLAASSDTSAGSAVEEPTQETP